MRPIGKPCEVLKEINQKSTPNNLASLLCGSSVSSMPICRREIKRVTNKEVTLQYYPVKNTISVFKIDSLYKPNHIREVEYYSLDGKKILFNPTDNDLTNVAIYYIADKTKDIILESSQTPTNSEETKISSDSLREAREKRFDDFIEKNKDNNYYFSSINLAPDPELLLESRKAILEFTQNNTLLKKTIRVDISDYINFYLNLSKSNKADLSILTSDEFIEKLKQPLRKYVYDSDFRWTNSYIETDNSDSTNEEYYHIACENNMEFFIYKNTGIVKPNIIDKDKFLKDLNKNINTMDNKIDKLIEQPDPKQPKQPNLEKLRKRQIRRDYILTILSHKIEYMEYLSHLMDVSLYNMNPEKYIARHIK